MAAARLTRLRGADEAGEAWPPFPRPTWTSSSNKARVCSQRGQKTYELAPAPTAGIARNEFGKGPVEIYNLVAFLQGQGNAEKFDVDKPLAKITAAK